ncbi:ABC transporter related protein [Richelia sinica FACHB-800]|uniref:ABC transporter related protein n=1 Tax=Richelia sinica FACHB-800 TaxID=1357546 RepID=A0A975T3H6_9NOST|nr:ABC transporter ATP-binding protein [Richelia sinica]MBD2666514.1 ABC transporter ATP-binding protein [Richelia sinica FACHB-800]QXE21498.1 ABC transporter related protein [Richelia sinica FACHB-800]
MGEKIAISLNNVSKCFKRYNRPVDRLKEILLPHKNYGQEFWALRNISFEIIKGETMGIIGRNGAGKSTLLQIICKTLTPTSGEVQVNGRVAALLELGAGFNPEFTGRENVYMNGAIMGLSPQEIDERFDKVAAFADIGDFIDQSVKTYSSGMYVRLAFASAIHVDPEILIVDEALAVGDMFFQAKCMARMREMMDNGVTVLFVSHDIGSVKSLCQRCTFLEQGEIKSIGKASQVTETYVSTIRHETNQELNKQIAQTTNSDYPPTDNFLDTTKKIQKALPTISIVVNIDRETEFAEGAYRYGDGGAKILDIKILNHAHKIANHIEYKQDFFIQAAILFEKSFATFCFGYLIKDLKGIELIGTTTTTENLEIPSVNAGDIYVVEAKTKNTLNDGIYTIAFGVELPVTPNQQHIYLDLVDNAVVFKVNPPENPLDKFWSKTYAPVTLDFAKIHG